MREHNIDVIEVPLDKIPEERRYSIYPQDESLMSHFMVIDITNPQREQIDSIVDNNPVVFIWESGIDSYHQLRDKVK